MDSPINEYQPPAVDERVPVGDPLIVGYPSPAWRRPEGGDRPSAGPAQP